jgi:hypothetical protein
MDISGGLGHPGERHADTGNHSIEQNSLKAMLQIEKALNIFSSGSGADPGV